MPRVLNAQAGLLTNHEVFALCQSEIAEEEAERGRGPFFESLSTDSARDFIRRPARHRLTRPELDALLPASEMRDRLATFLGQREEGRSRDELEHIAKAVRSLALTRAETLQVLNLAARGGGWTRGEQVRGIGIARDDLALIVDRVDDRIPLHTQEAVIAHIISLQSFFDALPENADDGADDGAEFEAEAEAVKRLKPSIAVR